MSSASSSITRLRYHAEALLVKMAYGLACLLPVPVASAVGGYIASIIGPRVSRTEIARKNLARAMPDLDKAQTEEIIRGMWNNIGRTFVEYPHITRMDFAQMRELAVLEGIEHIRNADLAGKGGIFFTGHLGNFEFGPKLFASHGFPLHVVFRRSNNPGLHTLIHTLRNRYLAGSISKGKAGSRQMIEILKKGERIGIMLDQKMNDGIVVKFFGMDAMTAPAVARLALKYGCQILPTRIIRTAGVRHKVIVYPPIEIPNTGNLHNDVHTIMSRINSTLEGWIREYPEQWFWVHNRWPQSSLIPDKNIERSEYE
jgi:Kdo2-lipid IVA lauroyltransferase/acyltransferase